MAFLKRNIYYVLMIVCVLAITAVVTTVAVLNTQDTTIDAGGDKNPPVEVPGGDDNDKTPPVVEKKFLVTMPVAGGVVGKEFNDSELVFDNTLGEYSVHLGVDLNGEVGADIKAGFEGTVLSVDTDVYSGSTVTIKHKDGFTSVFKLVDQVSVKRGDKVTENTVIGKVGDQFYYECMDAPHVHYEILKDDVNVDPMTYIVDADK